ncbi:hypothetical protein P872_03975 [Rhodonellum psychrophilum GCM71 = DSM 17998]|uniref:Viral A-type inclusion protein n=2 Tax=Rhodonellum TaxID=336827 RepID=U5C3R8_9BACT|nr:MULTISPECIES: hypothetical protein [Rhodonellum]ERM82827.1 hypothetical protein P872_03975 [Rhodonellum psychrophilum GCM71 = DSM 17998]SDY96826.1 hypothetical protein SAMN05444412_10493 [Rhodonellum ikkaensis]
MNSSLKYLFFYFLFILFSSCSPNGEESNDLLKEEVIAIHDEVMPKMGELKSLHKEILLKIDLLKSDSSKNAADIQELQVLANNLDASFEGMFIWMRQFKSTYEGMNEEEITQYLLEQKKMVEKVNLDIKKNLAEAKSELDKS